MRSAIAPASLLLVLSAGLLGASCRDVVAGESTRDAAQELCGTLQRCYGAEAYDCGAIEQRFGRDQAQDQSFLAAFDERCTESCPGSRDCLDRPPICAAQGEACGAGVGCCGAGIGTLECGAQSGSSGGAGDAGECCLPDGIRCTDDPNACCTSCIEVGNESFCGGFECTSVDQPCRSSLDCCSRFCALAEGDTVKTCQRKTCADLGDACLSATDCCPSEFAASDAGGAIDCVENRCSYALPVKLLAGAPCAAPEDCESGECVVIEGSDEKRCAGVGCVPEFADCASDVDCCQGGEVGVAPNAYPLECDLSVLSPRCVVNPTCQPPPSPELPPVGCCSIGGAACVQGSECCSGSCKADGTCAEGDAPICAALGCHSLCQVGSPMRADAAAPAGACDATNSTPELRACVENVRERDAYCGCQGWDEVCVQLARVHCGASPSQVCLL